MHVDKWRDATRRMPAASVPHVLMRMWHIVNHIYMPISSWMGVLYGIWNAYRRAMCPSRRVLWLVGRVMQRPPVFWGKLSSCVRSSNIWLIVPSSRLPVPSHHRPPLYSYRSGWFQWNYGLLHEVCWPVKVSHIHLPESILIRLTFFHPLLIH